MSQYTLQTQYRAKNITPAAQVRAVFGMPRTIEAITIHHWGSLGQRFETVRDYLSSKNGRQVSAHYVVQDGMIARLANLADATWHAGNPRGNATTIGIELRPEATDGDYATAAQLIRELREVYGNLPLIPHNRWAATQCPGKWDLGRLDTLARGGNPAPQPPVAPPQPVQAGPIQWIVDRGDTLSKIVEYYKGPSVTQIAAANSLRNPDDIREGQVLTIPGPLVWIVDRGDTLGEIAQYYAVSVDYLARLNRLANPDDIKEGQVLKVL